MNRLNPYQVPKNILQKILVGWKIPKSQIQRLEIW